MSLEGTFFVADVGNSTIDIGEFSAAALPEKLIPLQKTKVALGEFESRSAKSFGCKWLENLQGSRWLIGSVNQAGATLLGRWLEANMADSVRLLNHADFEIPSTIRNRHTVGIDRLAAATSANQIRSPDRPAIIVDAGTAITVDCVSHAGVFLGGMIAPGLRLCAEALGRKTDQLPTLRIEQPNPPQLIGDETKVAIESGSYWLVAAGVDGILERLKQELAGPCDVFVTGGSMPMLLEHLGRHEPEHRPDLVLNGLAMSTLSTP